ncbi:MAG: tRNA lysidine(34) synthetase TilS [Chloroflexi bacterium]|nr:tRNA lysidine(34) synthetase TilS [Chloroflexota bacterium]MDA1269731.1 tRNA lysidine(34) synthetase TilS [Chloroflexota bacterium]PKB59066.1 MAG: tRNA lysidine(34) synthetase TilS [SAR202 cluster bacterium Casp-Chloro-G2]
MANAADLERQVASALQRAGYSNSGATLVVGASGGPDSSALLYALDRLKEAHGLSLHVAHLNHNFRGQEAEDDAAFVAQIAGELGLPVTVVKEDPHEYQRERGISSFEQGAREMRYAFLARVAKAAGARAVTVGHTSDDLAETVLLHVLRGAGLHGLRGMAEVSKWPWPAGSDGLQLFRPLLDVTKARTGDYCREIDRPYRTDSGNYMWRFTRNRVRQDLMPRLAQDYNPQVRNALVRLSRTAADQLDFVERELDRVWPGLAETTPADSSQPVNEVCFARPELAAIHPALQRLALRRGYILVTGDATRLRESHLVAMEELAQGGRGGRRLELPGGVVLRQDYSNLTLTRQQEADCPYPEFDGEYQIKLPATPGAAIAVSAGPWSLRMQLGMAGVEPAWATGVWDEWTARLDRRALGDGATVRTWCPGDRIQPLGMTGQKKLQDLFTDLRVPRPWRGKVPLLETEKGIAWVVGHRIADWAKVDADAGRPVLWLRFRLDPAD